ncbi:hypothetical protein [Rhizobium sp.]
MIKTFCSEFAVCSEGRCDLTGLPCLHALNLARQMARASLQLGDTLPETFGLEADVEIPCTLRACGLSVVVADAQVAVSRQGRPLASVGLPGVAMDSGHLPSSSAIAAVGWRAH